MVFLIPIFYPTICQSTIALPGAPLPPKGTECALFPAKRDSMNQNANILVAGTSEMFKVQRSTLTQHQKLFLNARNRLPCIIHKIALSLIKKIPLPPPPLTKNKELDMVTVDKRHISDLMLIEAYAEKHKAEEKLSLYQKKIQHGAART